MKSENKHFQIASVWNFQRKQGRTGDTSLQAVSITFAISIRFDVRRNLRRHVRDEVEMWGGKKKKAYFRKGKRRKGWQWWQRVPAAICCAASPRPLPRVLSCHLSEPLCGTYHHDLNIFSLCLQHCVISVIYFFPLQAPEV